MALRTMGLLPVVAPLIPDFSSSHVLLAGNRLQMRRMDTRVHATKVVEFEAFGDGAC